MTHKSNRWALGAIIAGIGGYIAGILTAPKSGKETRQDIKVEATNLGKEAENELKKLHDELSKLIEQAQVKGKDIKSSLDTSSKDVLDKAHKAKKSAQQAIAAFKKDYSNNEHVDKAIKEVKKAVDDLKNHAKNTEK
ncbi:YtxH domain-containing protein [Candidatus Saccharibacteria bacterium]|jgi:gas vesicle protein|nr:YtxH domain-containing protein [Candidatus Saccharibacteria bacterium]